MFQRARNATNTLSKKAQTRLPAITRRLTEAKGDETY